jgi:hypothetical protein
MVSKDSTKIGIKDAIRLKHTLNETITYGGLNARQVDEIVNLTPDQRAELNRQLSEIRKTWFFPPDYAWYAGILISGCCWLFFRRPIISEIALLFAIYCTGQLCYRAGVQYGYIRGYESGHEGGIHKVLGITSEDAKDIRERAVEMEMDEMVLNKWDEVSENLRPAACPETESGGNDIEERKLCIDGSCIGLIGADGRCKICGKVHPDSESK